MPSIEIITTDIDDKNIKEVFLDRFCTHRQNASKKIFGEVKEADCSFKYLREYGTGIIQFIGLETDKGVVKLKEKERSVDGKTIVYEVDTSETR